MTQPSMLALFVIALAMHPKPVSAQENRTQPASPAAAEKVGFFERTAGAYDSGYSSTGASDDVKSFDPALATRTWLESASRSQREKSDAYFEGGYWLILWNFLLTAAISVFLLASQFSARLGDFSERVTKIRTFQIVCYEIQSLRWLERMKFLWNRFSKWMPRVRPLVSAPMSQGYSVRRALRSMTICSSNAHFRKFAP